MKVLFLRQGALGDSLCALPILQTLRGLPSLTRLDFAGGSEVGRLFEIAGVVDRAISSESLPLWRTTSGESLDSLAGWDFVVGERALPVSDVRGISFDVRVDDRAARPASLQLFERFAEAWAARFEEWLSHDGKLRLVLPSIRATRSQRPRLWLHAGAGSSRKIWPALTRDLGTLLSARIAAGWQCTVSFGPVERAMRAALELPKGVDCVEDVPLEFLARGLARSTVFCGHDSGPGHLAAALGIPTVTLYGDASTMPVWRPYGIATSRAISWTSLSTSAFLESVTQALEAARPSA